VVGTIPATTLREGLALALSSCGDWDNPAGDTVGLLGLGAMGSKAYDLFAVCPLTQGAQSTSHVFGGLGGANQNGAALWRGAVLGCVHGDNNHHGQTMGGELVGLLYIICAEIDCEAPFCGVACPFDGLGAVLVCVRKPVAPSVGFDYLPECIGVHLFTLSG
jgi:hypothetical protein